MMNLANILTLARLILLPFIVVLFFIPAKWAAFACLTLYAIGAITDFLEGGLPENIIKSQSSALLLTQYLIKFSSLSP